MKLRATLTQQGDEIKGTIECGADPAFNLEAIMVIIEQVAVVHQVDAKTVIQDLWRLNWENEK